MAQHNIGIMYLEGKGVIPDVVEAVKWFSMAAAQGDANSQYIIGIINLDGTRDFVKRRSGSAWQRRRATSMLKLPSVYCTGRDGVSPRIMPRRRSGIARLLSRVILTPKPISAACTIRAEVFGIIRSKRKCIIAWLPRKTILRLSSISD